MENPKQTFYQPIELFSLKPELNISKEVSEPAAAAMINTETTTVLSQEKHKSFFSQYKWLFFVAGVVVIGIIGIYKYHEKRKRENAKSKN
jgi:hypothetical protein